MSVCGSSNNFLLEPRILTLIQGRQHVTNSVLRSRCFRDNFVYNWDEIQFLFGPNFLKDDLYPELTYETCSKYVEVVRPVWKETFNFCHQYLEKNKSSLYENFEWFGNAKILQKFLDSCKSPTFVIEGCLLFTSILENNLGNVYFTITKKRPPHLLKDLLSTQELKKFFSPFPIFFLKLLLGTPNSVNLRNIVWHGFPAPEDIPEYYLSVLIVLLNTFSHFIRQQVFLIIPRDKVICRTIGFEDKILRASYPKDESTFHQILRDSKYILKSHSIFWEQIYKYFQNENYEQFIILILPQIELILRLIYSECNLVDVGAKLDEYYIIIDTIFEDKVINEENTKNNIFSHLDHGTLKLLYDLFISQNGPCIRDKVSHGEINFDALDKSICSILFLVSLNLLEGPKAQFFNLSSYESKFHINSVVFSKICNLKQHIKLLREMKIPKELEHFADWNAMLPTIVFKVRDFEKIKIFLRPKQENELVGILSKVLVCIELSCDNLLYSFQTHFETFSKKQLRSPRRKTLENMLISLPFICNTLEIMMQEVEEIFYHLQYLEKDLSDEFYNKCLKFLKNFLKYIENMAKYCQCNKNEWEKSTKICHIFRETLEDFRKEVVYC